jgi:hypothetical protein
MTQGNVLGQNIDGPRLLRNLVGFSVAKKTALDLKVDASVRVPALNSCSLS